VTIQVDTESNAVVERICKQGHRYMDSPNPFQIDVDTERFVLHIDNGATAVGQTAQANAPTVRTYQPSRQTGPNPIVAVWCGCCW
jgi:hypothetical protein